MVYETEQEIDNLLQELDIGIIDIDFIYSPSKEDFKAINEFYDILE